MTTKAARRAERRKAEQHRLKQIAYRKELRAQRREVEFTPITRVPVDPNSPRTYFTMWRNPQEYDSCEFDVDDLTGDECKEEDFRLFVLVATEPQIRISGKRLKKGSITTHNAKYGPNHRPEMLILLELDPLTGEPLSYKDDDGEDVPYDEISVSAESPLFKEIDITSVIEI